MSWVGLSIVSWLALWLLVVFSWGLKEIDEAQAPTNAQFDSDDTLAATDYPTKTTWRNYRIKWLDRRDGFPSLGMTSITAI